MVERLSDEIVTFVIKSLKSKIKYVLSSENTKYTTTY